MQTQTLQAMSQSQVCEYDLDHGIIYTDVRPAPARVLAVAFLLLIFSVPIGQLVWELTQRQSPVVLQVFQTMPTRTSLRKYEENLENASVPRNFFQPLLQSAVSGALGFGSGNVVMGRDGWLFYMPGVNYLTGPGFLGAEQLQNRHKKMVEEGKIDFNPDPRQAILQFSEQCRQHGVRLVLLPIPDKAQIQPAQVSRNVEFSNPSPPPNNPDYMRFVEELRQNGVEVLDILPSQLQPDDRRFLAQDTHWTPQWMDQVARQVAERLRSQLSATTAALIKQPAQAARLGDLVDMLRLPADQILFQPQPVMIERIVDAHTNLPWQPSAAADVLVLGDSFCNIFSSNLMGWGDSAGFVEHLSYHLGRPLDRIVRNDAGAHATREMLAKEFQRGHDRLAGKKLVIWEFAARELACGDWKLLPITLGKKCELGMYVPAPGKTVIVRGVVRATSFAPRPGSVTYKDHILTLHLTDLESADDPSANGKQVVAFAWSMRDNKPMSAAHYRPGDVVQLHLQPWSDVESKYASINQSTLDDLEAEKLNSGNEAWVENVDPKIGGSPSTVGLASKINESNSLDELNSITRKSEASASDASRGNGDAESFRKTCAKIAGECNTLATSGSDGWLFLCAELRHISVGRFWGDAAAKVSKATSPRNADPLPAILDFNEQLKSLGIELILAPVPCKALVYPEKLDGGTPDRRLDTVHQQFLKLLSGKGVKVLDLTPIFIQEKSKPGGPSLYCKTDTHWSPYACEVTARKIKEMIGAPAFLNGKADVFRTRAETRTITGDLTDGKRSEQLPVRIVEASGISLEDKASPIVLLGDSHTLVYHVGADLHGTGAGLADQLAVELGIPVDVIGVRGSGATPARVNFMRRIKADPSYLAGKKVVIWCFASLEFTEGTGWTVLKLVK